MSLFPSHDLSLNRYYYTFYSYHPDTPNVLNCLVYDQDQTLVETQDISFNGKTMSEMMAFVENSNANPYAIGKAGSDYRSMDLTFGTVYKKSFQEKQRQKLMTYLNSNYKNVHGTSRSVFTITASGGKYYVDGYTDPAPNLFAPKEGYYVFDQSDSTNVSHPLVLSTQDGSSTYYSSMFTEGTQGSLNGYTIVDISAGTPDLYYYCTAHSGMGGQLLNFAAAVSYTVSIVYNDTYGQDIYHVAELANYYTDASGIYLNAGSKYAIDLSVLNGTSFNPIVGTTNDVSSSIISDTSIVKQVGDVLYVRPLLSNLYLFDQTVALMTKPLENGYYVKTIQNWTGTSVFTLMEPTEITGIVQRDLSFNAGDVVLFHVGHSSMDNFNLVFGTTVDDVATALGSSYVSQIGDIITLDLSSYSGGAVYYFEDSSANMGYVNASSLAPSIMRIKGDDGDLTGSTLKNHISNSYGDASIVGNVSIDTSVKTLGTGSLKIIGQYTNRVILPNVTTIPQNFSISFWLKPTTFNYGGHFLWYYHNTDNYYSHGFGLKLRDFGLQFYEKQASNFNLSYNPEDGNWHHICLVFAFWGITGSGLYKYTVERYVDNSRDTSSTQYVHADYSLDYPEHWFGGNPDEIYLDDYRFYDYALSDSNVSDIFTNKKPQSVTVANGVFVIDGVSKPEITFTNGDTYVFDQSDSTNAGFPIVFGETPESSTLYTTGVTVVGTPGQAGAYTRIDYTGTTGALYYYNNIIPGMGYDSNTISYNVTVADTPPKFYLNSVRQPVIFTANTKYYFYQYDSTNENYPIVFGTVEDTEPYFTDGVTTVGTPGQSGAYTILDLSAGFTGSLVYFSSGATEMGSFEIYTVKVVQNWAGNNVFSIQAPGEDFSYNQPDLSFNTGDNVFFDVGDSTMSGYSLVFGTEIDNAVTILGSPYVTDLGTLISLNLPSNYTGGAVYYFEDTSAGMGYVEATTYVTVTEVHKTVELQSNGTFTLTSGSADLSYCAIGGGGSGGYGQVGASENSRGGNGGNGGQVIYGNYTFENSINYTITIGAGGTGHTTSYTDGGATSISSSGSTIVNAPGGLKGGINLTPNTVVANSSTGAHAVDNTSDTPSPGQNGTGPFNYGAGGGAGANAGTGGVYKNSQGGNYGGGAGGDLTDTTYAAREGKDAEAYTGSGGGGGSGNGASSPQYNGGHGGSGVVVIYAKTNSYSFTGTKNERTENVDVIQEVALDGYPVTVSNEVFFIDTGSGAQYKPQITFTDGETYVFDQSDPSNAGYPIVFGTIADDTSTLYTTGVTVVGTPGQPGAYTRIDYTGSTTLYYFSSGATYMGYGTFADVTDQLSYHNNATTYNISGSSFTNLVNSSLNGTIYGTVYYETNIGGRPCYLIPKRSQVLTAISLPASLPTNSCTFSAYFYRTSATNDNWTRLVGFHTTSVYHSVQTGGNSIGTTEKIIVYDNSGNNVYTGNPISIYDEWIHFCITYYNNGSRSSGKIYINGVNETTYSNSTFDIEQYVIGGYGSLSGPQYYGGFYLNDVRIYNKVLSDIEVSTLYDYISQ